MFLVSLVCALILSPHPEKTYQDFAKGHPFRFNSVLVKGKNGIQNGIIINPKVVATAAHGVVNGARAIVYNGQEYPVQKVTLNPYYDKYSGKYDWALVTIDGTFSDTKPVFFKKEFRIEWEFKENFNNSKIAATCLDITSHNFLAFAIVELDRFFDLPQHLVQTNTLRSIVQSFILPDSSDVTLEVRERSKLALWLWKKIGKPPCALPNPGASGSPVWLEQDKATYLIGLIIAGSNVASGINQGIFSLFYLSDDLGNYVLDPDFQKALDCAF